MAELKRSGYSALHVWSGDIMKNINDANNNVTMRFQGNNYFLQAFKTALEYLNDKENIQIYSFCQGAEKDF